MEIKCDEAMRRSKESSARETFRLKKWRCTQNCESCICGMKFDSIHGFWEHNDTQGQ